MALGDIGVCGSPDPGEVASLAERLPGQVVALGDIAYPNGTFAEITECFGVPYAGVLDRIIPVMGNHEYDTANGQGWKDFFGRSDTYFTQTLGSWLLVVVDTECNLIGGCDVDDRQQVWLSQTLANAPECVVVAMHRPYRTSYASYDREWRSQAIESIVQNNGVDVVLTGHVHLYERIDFGNLQQFTVGTGGSGIRPANSPVSGSESIVEEHGLLAMELGAGSYNWEFINTDSTVRDSGSRSCT